MRVMRVMRVMRGTPDRALRLDGLPAQRTKRAALAGLLIAASALGGMPGATSDAAAQGRFAAGSGAASGASAPVASPMPEFLVAARHDHAGVLQRLLQAGADVNQKDVHRNTALHVAIREDSPQVFDLLMKQAAVDVNAINQAGETPVMLAAIKGKLDWVKTLVKRGALINEPGWSALHYAAAGPEESVVRWLVAQGAKLDARSPNGTTPLMMAAGYGGRTSAEILMAAGADVTLRNDQQLSAADFARRAGQDELAEQLDQRAKATRR